MKKACTSCGHIKPLEEYHRASANVDGYKNVCKLCKSVENNTYRSTMAPEQKYYYNEQKYYKRNRLAYSLYTYNIPHEEYIRILQSQENRCAICFRIPKETEFDKRNPFTIDICPKTGKLKGLFCIPCKTGLGLLKKDMNILQNAVKYLGEDK